MHPRATTTLTALLSILSAGCAPAQDDGIAKKVAAIAAEHLARPGAVGLSIGVARGGAVVLQAGYGLADAEFDAPADPATMFRIGSITKQFTAAAVLRLCERHELALDDALAKYVAEFSTGEQLVTIQQLLSHTAGIPNYTDVGEEWEKKWPLELSHLELLGLVAGKPLDFAPGTDWRYSNTGYFLLGMVIEKVSGKPYGEFMQAELFAPLGLLRTRYDSNVELLKNRAQGYAFAAGKLTNDAQLGMSQPGAAGGLISTGGDLVRWSLALSSGKVVTPESFDRMTKPTVLPSGRDTHYGFGLMNGEFAGHRRIAHGGGIHGFNSMLFWLPDDDLHVAVVSNGERLSSGKVADAIARAVLDIAPVVAKDRPVPAELRTALAGSYRVAEADLGLNVFERDGKLMAQGDHQEAFGLLWQGEREFRASFDHEVKLVFAADGKSFELHQGGGVMTGKRVEKGP